MAKKKTKNVATAGVRPYSFLAIICERVLQETDRTTTFVRVIDLITVQGESDEMPAGAIQFTIAIGCRAPGFVGKAPFSLRVITPTGDKKELLQGELEFSDPVGGMAFIQTTLAAKIPGLYWFDVLLESHRMAKIPLRIAYEKKKTPASQSGDQKGRKSPAKKPTSQTAN